MTRAVRIILYALAAWAVVAVVLWVGYRALTASSRQEARLAQSQAGAALENGKDAVATVGSAAEREALSEAVGRSNEKDIRNAEGADAAVAAPVRDVGLAKLCQRRAYRSDPKCLQRPAP